MQSRKLPGQSGRMWQVAVKWTWILSDRFWILWSHTWVGRLDRETAKEGTVPHQFRHASLLKAPVNKPRKRLTRLVHSSTTLRKFVILPQISFVHSERRIFRYKKITISYVLSHNPYPVFKIISLLHKFIFLQSNKLLVNIDNDECIL